jgi:hypothetical protein
LRHPCTIENESTLFTRNSTASTTSAIHRNYIIISSQPGLI